MVDFTTTGDDAPDLLQLLRAANGTCEETGSKHSVHVDLNSSRTFGERL